MSAFLKTMHSCNSQVLGVMALSTLIDSPSLVLILRRRLILFTMGVVPGSHVYCLWSTSSFSEGTSLTPLLQIYTAKNDMLIGFEFVMLMDSIVLIWTRCGRKVDTAQLNGCGTSQGQVHMRSVADLHYMEPPF